jgi:hypothetical protein
MRIGDRQHHNVVPGAIYVWSWEGADPEAAGHGIVIVN